MSSPCHSRRVTRCVVGTFVSPSSRFRELPFWRSKRERREPSGAASLGHQSPNSAFSAWRLDRRRWWCVPRLCAGEGEGELHMVDGSTEREGADEYGLVQRRLVPAPHGPLA